MKSLLRRINHASLLLVLLLSILVPITQRPVSAATGCEVTDKLVNPCRPWLGTAAGKYPQADSNVTAQMLYHEQRIGKQVDIVHTYHGVGSNQLSTDDTFFATRPDTTLFTDWKPASSWSAAGGGNATANANIDKMAASVKALGNSKIFMTIWHEPENDVTSDTSCPNVSFVGSAGTPTQYKAMWKNVQTRFASAGVSNVVWVYDIMNYDPYDCLVASLYPGDSAVDWIMFNAYGGPKQLDYVANVSHMYNYLTTHSTSSHNYLSKPWGIVEWNIRNATTDQGVSYYDQAKAALDNNTFPLLKAYMAFDSVGPDGNENRVAYDATGVWSDTKHQHYINFANDPTFSVTTPPQAPDTTAPAVNVTSPATGATVSGQVTVSGSASDDTAVTTVSLLVDGALTSSPIAAPFDSFSTTWDATTVPDGSHTLQLEATDAAGNVGKSSAISVIVANPDAVAPSVPDGVEATILDTTSLKLSWNASSDANNVAGYHVYRDGVIVGTIAGSSTNFTDTGLSGSVTYAYSVDAYDASGNTSAQSSPISVMVYDGVAPSAPGNVVTTSVTGTSVDLAWQASTDNIGVVAYDVYRDGMLLATVNSGTVYHDATVEQGQTYTYTIAARDAVGNISVVSNALNVTVPDVTAPSTPVYLSASLSGTNINVAWEESYDNVGVVRYNVLRNGVQIATTPNSSYSDSTGQSGQTYTYTVQAVDAAGNVSATSYGARVTVPDTIAPTVPGKPIAKLSTDNKSVSMTWTAATDNVSVDHYEVWRKGVFYTNVTGLAFTDTAIDQGVTYVYKLYAVDAAGNKSGVSAASAPIVVPDTVGPTAPANLTGTSPTIGNIKLTWTASSDNVGVTGYDVYRGTTKVATVGGTTLTHTVTGLTSGVSYKFSIQAFDAAGNLSPMSTQITVKAK